MTFDAYLKIDGIDGDSTDDKHAKWIEVDAFSHRISQATGGKASAQGSHAGGRADHGDFMIRKRLDSASPKLSVYCCDGTHIPEITMEICRALGDQTVFMKYVFKNSIVSSVNASGTSSGDDAIPTEDVTVRYGEINWEYTPTDPSGGGKTGAAIQSGWNAVTNKKI